MGRNTTYVRDELKGGLSDKSKARELGEKIVDRASGVFQWVVLVVSTILELDRNGESVKAIRKKLQNIPTKLENLYQEILRRIEDKDLSQSIQLMQWICFAQRPLSLAEVRSAMAVDADASYSPIRELHQSEDYLETGQEMGKRVKSLSQGLAEVKELDDRQVAQFINQSVNDYLIQSGLQQLRMSSAGDVIGRAHFRLSRFCIRYIAMEEVLRFRSDAPHDLED